MMAYTERLHPKGVPISGLLEYERVVISLVEVYERVGNLSFGSVKRLKRANSCIFGCKLKRREIVVVL